MLKTAEKPMNAIEKIANYAAELRFEDLTEVTILCARQTVLDTLGTTLGGYQTPLGKRTVNFAATMYQGEKATLIGDGRRSTLEGAAWANGVMSKHLGMDDCHRTAGHVAAELIPVVLAVGEHRHLNGRQIITALAVGYDVLNAIQPNVKKYQLTKGLDQKGQAGTLASAITAGMVLGLDQNGLANALALSMDMACGTEQYVYDSGYCDTKDLLAGYAARNGIYAAKLAAFGFRGPPGALDGSYGYFRAFGDGYHESYFNEIGTCFALESNSFKPHAGCRHVHSCVDVAQEILCKGSPALDEITSIEIGSYRDAITPEFRVDIKPETVGLAGFSLPTAVAVTLVQGSWYREDIERYTDPAVQHLLSLTTVYLDEKIEAVYPGKNGCIVRITTKEGTIYEGRVDYAKGEPENMLTDAEFGEKFHRLVGGLLSDDRIEKILDSTSRLEDLEDISSLVRLTVRS